MATWRVYCVRNTMLKQLYFGYSDDVASDVRKLEEQIGSCVAHWDFDQHDLICFDLDTFATEPQAIASVAKLVATAPPAGWTIIAQNN